MHENFPATEERLCNTEKEAWSLFSGGQDLSIAFSFQININLYITLYKYIYINQKRFIDVVLSFVNINCISWQGKLDPMRLLVAPSNQSIRNQYTYIWYWQRTVMGAAMWSIVIDESLYCVVCVCDFIFLLFCFFTDVSEISFHFLMRMFRRFCCAWVDLLIYIYN